jgi:benzil reductase ((S)-benzoin forming)
MRLALVTGTSSGIGDALAHELLRRGWSVIGVSRRPSVIETDRYTHLRVDLQDPAAMIGRIEASIGARLSDPGVGRLGLVNNAAHIALLGPVPQIDPAELLKVYAVNIAAPVSLMGLLLRRGRPGCPLRIVNVSSGAATRPLPGMAAYCTSKAALRMAGMVLAAELEDDGPTGRQHADATILSYEPGIVDTEMQAAARSAPQAVMPMAQMFKQFAAEGRLAPPAAPAAEIADYLEGDRHPKFSEWRHGGPQARQT